MADRQAGQGFERDSDEGITDKVKDAAREAKHAAGEVKDQTADKAEDLAAEARDRGRELAREGKERARSQADDQKDRVSEGLRTVADALRRGRDQMPEEQRTYGKFLGVVADRAEDASRYLERRDVDSLTREMRSFARQHAPVFLSGAFTVGLLGARFIKSSTPTDSHDYGGYGERSDYLGGREYQDYGGYREGKYRSYPSEPLDAPGSYEVRGSAGERAVGPTRTGERSPERMEPRYELDRETGGTRETGRTGGDHV